MAATLLFRHDVYPPMWQTMGQQWRHARATPTRDGRLC
jgi:hypothetical protein